jgi:hypothetical protein
MVKSYDPNTGRLVTIEGNSGNRVCERTYDLSDPAVLARFDGFGRPALGDLTPSCDTLSPGGPSILGGPASGDRR